MYSRVTQSLLRNRFVRKPQSLIRHTRRFNYTRSPVQSSFNWLMAVGGVTLGVVTYFSTSENSVFASGQKVDYDAVRKDIEALLSDDSWDDGNWGPVLVRLAWHASGTYDKRDGSGGADGATMRFSPEANHGANAGLQHARNRLDAIKQKYPGLSYADLWSLAGVVAVESLGGPKILWRPGRTDKPDGSYCPPDGRLPDASKGQDHIREIFYRMGFNDREIVALAGAHALGRCHTDRSGYSGPWTHSPTVFSNDYFTQLLENKWTKKKWNGPEQYEDPSGKLMMLPADLAFIEDKEFRKYVELYAKDEEAWFKDFAAAYAKLLELGVKPPARKWW